MQRSKALHRGKLAHFGRSLELTSKGPAARFRKNPESFASAAQIGGWRYPQYDVIVASAVASHLRVARG
jgi:hypothetical protein